MDAARGLQTTAGAVRFHPGVCAIGVSRVKYPGQRRTARMNAPLRDTR
jgi:hypothetical protein